MKKLPLPAARGAEIFFPSAGGGKKRNNRTDAGITIEQKRVSGYRTAWKKKGLTQMALWLPSEVAEKLRIKSAASGKSISALAAEILSQGL